MDKAHFKSKHLYHKKLFHKTATKLDNQHV